MGIGVKEGRAGSVEEVDSTGEGLVGEMGRNCAEAGTDTNLAGRGSVDEIGR